jgi:hypothetical protein
MSKGAKEAYGVLYTSYTDPCIGERATLANGNRKLRGALQIFVLWGVDVCRRLQEQYVVVVEEFCSSEGLGMDCYAQERT